MLVPERNQDCYDLVNYVLWGVWGTVVIVDDLVCVFDNCMQAVLFVELGEQEEEV